MTWSSRYAPQWRATPAWTCQAASHPADRAPPETSEVDVATAPGDMLFGRRVDGSELPVTDLPADASALRGGRADLERSVRERTRELSDVNASLHEERQQLLCAARLSSLGTLAAGIAREIADPLADVTGLVDALRAGEVAASREDEYFTAIEDRLDCMHGLLETVLDLARSPAPGPSRFVAGEVLASCRRLLAPVLRERGVELALIDVDQLVLHADRSLLLQAILDVLMYAVYAAPAGTAVTARVALDGDRCGVCITDRGPAALPDDLRCLGDAFVTMRPGEEGTGQGLSIARSILCAHGGDLAVESTPGQGTAVTLWLPRGLRGDAGAPR